jgi:hypothetical protein
MRIDGRFAGQTERSSGKAERPVFIFHDKRRFVER